MQDDPTLARSPFETYDARPLSAFGSHPDWVDQRTWKTLRDAYDEPLEGPYTFPQDIDLGLLQLCQPLMARSASRLQAQLDPGRPFLSFEAEAAVDLLLPDLAHRLGDIVQRPLVVEMHAARLRGELRGETPAERFRSYLDRLRSPRRCMELFGEYPLLASRVVACCERWEEASLELLTRLEQDHPRLDALFGGTEGLGRLRGFRGQRGDLHQNGRTVVIAEFDSGIPIVYKPRSLSLDEHFQGLLRWFRRAAPEFEFRTLRIVKRESHGWVEYAEYGECEGDADQEAFYRRLGGLLAILQALRANDIHYENLVACGAHPVLVDLETLFHPSAFDYSLTSTKYSVLEVGILPLASGDPARLDHSAIGADRSRVGKAMGWRHLGTDELCFGEGEFRLGQVTSQPKQKGEGAFDVRWERALLDGFRLAYRTIVRHREAWVEPGGLLDQFADDRTRCVLRPTSFYKSLLWNQYHPARSACPVKARGVLDRLESEVPFRPFLSQVTGAETADLLRGDVPIFHSQPGSTALADSSGQWIPDFFPRSALQAVKARIAGFGETDLKTQEWLICQALSGLREDPQPGNDRPASRQGKIVPDSGLESARQIGDFLDDRAIRSGSQATWAGYHRVGSSFFMTYLPPTLYSGQLGMVFFLARLAAETRIPKYRHLAEAGLDFFLDQQLERLLGQPKIGVFDGMGGVVYVLSHLAHLWPDRDLSAVWERLLERLEELIPEDRCLDVLSGSAGCLVALLGLHETTGSRKALDLADRCGEALSASIDFRGDAVTWRSDLFDRPLTGLSHGLTGVALAYAKLSRYRRTEPSRERVLRLVEFEDSYYDSAVANWRDLREPEAGTEGSGFMSAWCHGAPGIVAGRTAVARSLPASLRPKVLHQVDDAVAALSAAPPETGTEANLCHGSFGNVDLLLSVAQARGDAELEGRCNRWTQEALAHLVGGGSVRSWLDADKRLDLMLGAAGIGYALLRQHRPDRVPSVLLLEAPQSRRPSPPINLPVGRGTPRA